MEYIGGRFRRLRLDITVSLTDIYKYFGKSQTASNEFESLKYDSEVELDRKYRFAERNLEKLVYGRAWKKYRKLVREKSSAAKSYMKRIISNISLLSACRLQINNRLHAVESEISQPLQEYTEQTGGGIQKYYYLYRLFSHPMGRCYSHIRMKGKQEDVENADDAKRFMRIQKILAFREIKKTSKEIYKKLVRPDRRLAIINKISDIQELKQPKDESIITDALDVLHPGYMSLEEIAEDRNIQELVSS